MKTCIITSLLLLFVFSSIAQQQMTRKDFYGTWELSAINTVVLNDLKNDKGEPFMPTVYFEFKKNKRYSLYKEAVTTKGTFTIEFASMDTTTLLLTDDKGNNHRFLVTYEKKNGDHFLVFTENEKTNDRAEEAKNVTSFIKIKDSNLEEFRKKVEQEKKLDTWR